MSKLFPVLSVAEGVDLRQLALQLISLMMLLDTKVTTRCPRASGSGDKKESGPRNRKRGLFSLGFYLAAYKI